MCTTTVDENLSTSITKGKQRMFSQYENKQKKKYMRNFDTNW